MLALLLLGCQPPEKLGGDDTSGELACGPIYAPLAGYDTVDPVPADPHQTTLGAAPAPSHVRLNWADAPATTQAVLWHTDAATLATQVQYGTDPSYGTTVDGASFLLDEGGTVRVHETHLCDLAPGTTYHYRVGGEGAWSEDRTFTTAPAPGTSAPFRFVVMGDSRDDQATFGLLLDAAEEKSPDFYLFTGDAVDIGVNMEEWTAWFDATDGHVDRRPIVLAHGNHEFQARHFFGLVAQPGNEQWFSFDYGDAHFAFLNDTVARAGDREVQADWLAADLAATSAKWRFTAHHIPAYSSCTNHGSDEELRDLWSPVKEAGGVAIDFAGHNHNYERSFPLRDGVATAPELGTTYVVAAGAGAPLYGNDLANSFTAVAAVTEHYVLVEVADGTLTLSAHDLAGNVLDTFTTTR